jgi:repressor LexA
MSLSFENLTESQSKALAFIRKQIESQGSAPTLRELCSYMGFRAIGSAQDLVAALRRKGFVSPVEKQAARSLGLTQKAKALFGQSESGTDLVDLLQVPCLGSVPAGNPLEALEERVGTLSISSSLLPRPRPQVQQLFAVKTSGFSMMGAGIVDGDWLVVKVQQEADPGSIVVARVAGEVTCKRLLHDLKLGWYLQPENPNFKPLYAREHSFEVVGRVIALQRSI